MVSITQAYEALTEHSSCTSQRFTFGGYAKKCLYEDPGNSRKGLHTLTGPCHAGMTYLKDCEYLWSVYPRRAPPKPDESKRQPSGTWDTDPSISYPSEEPYLRWIISKKWSPWERCIPEKPLMVEGINAWSFNQIWNHGFFFTDMTIPANMLVNFLIATRSSYEWNWLTDVWWKLVQDGVHPSVAYWMSCLSNPGPDDTFTLYAFGNHVPIYAGKSVTAAFERFVLRDPAPGQLLQPVNQSCQYSPCNAIWGDESNVNRYGNKIVERYPDIWKEAKILCPKPPRARVFGYKMYDPGVGVFDETRYIYPTLLKLARAEQARMKLEFDYASFCEEIGAVHNISNGAAGGERRSNREPLPEEGVLDNAKPNVRQHRRMVGGNGRKPSAVRRRRNP